MNSHTKGLQDFGWVMTMLLSKCACGPCSRLGPGGSVLFRSRTRAYEEPAFPGARLVRLSPREPRRPAQSQLPSPNIIWPNREFVRWCQFLVCQQLPQINILEVRSPAEREKSISSALGITFQNYRKKRERGKKCFLSEEEEIHSSCYYSGLWKLESAPETQKHDSGLHGFKGTDVQVLPLLEKCPPVVQVSLRFSVAKWNIA